MGVKMHEMKVKFDCNGTAEHCSSSVGYFGEL